MIFISKRSLWLPHGDWFGDRPEKWEKCQGATVTVWARNGWWPVRERWPGRCSSLLTTSALRNDPHRHIRHVSRRAHSLGHKRAESHGTAEAQLCPPSPFIVTPSSTQSLAAGEQLRALALDLVRGWGWIKGEKQPSHH